jgi:hypothetical protein|nr:MAG TPA: Protein of unknown function (DUF3168) [Caudoviricetes sp.]
MSLFISKHIISSLQSNKAVTEAVGNRIYPVVIPVGAPEYPFINFTSSLDGPDETKDGSCADNVSTTLVVVSKTYEVAVNTANEVRYSIEGKTARYDKFEVIDSSFLSCIEDYLVDIDAFTITLSFNFKTIDL